MTSERSDELRETVKAETREEMITQDTVHLMHAWMSKKSIEVNKQNCFSASKNKYECSVLKLYKVYK